MVGASCAADVMVEVNESGKGQELRQKTGEKIIADKLLGCHDIYLASWLARKKRLLKMILRQTN